MITFKNLFKLALLLLASTKSIFTANSRKNVPAVKTSSAKQVIKLNTDKPKALTSPTNDIPASSDTKTPANTISDEPVAKKTKNSLNNNQQGKLARKYKAPKRKARRKRRNKGNKSNLSPKQRKKIRAMLAKSKANRQKKAARLQKQKQIDQKKAARLNAA